MFATSKVPASFSLSLQIMLGGCSSSEFEGECSFCAVNKVIGFIWLVIFDVHSELGVLVLAVHATGVDLMLINGVSSIVE